MKCSLTWRMGLLSALDVVGCHKQTNHLFKLRRIDKSKQKAEENLISSKLEKPCHISDLILSWLWSKKHLRLRTTDQATCFLIIHYPKNIPFLNSKCILLQYPKYSLEIDIIDSFAPFINHICNF